MGKYVDHPVPPPLTCGFSGGGGSTCEGSGSGWVRVEIPPSSAFPLVRAGGSTWSGSFPIVGSVTGSASDRNRMPRSTFTRLSPCRLRPISTCAAADFTSRTNTLLDVRSEEHTSELQSRFDLVCRLLLEKKNKK